MNGRCGSGRNRCCHLGVDCPLLQMPCAAHIVCSQISSSVAKGAYTFMKALIATLVCFFSISAAAQPPAASPQRSGPARPKGVPADFNDHQGFTELFNGKTLAGWDGDPAVWSVADGIIVGQFHSPEGQRNAQSYLVLLNHEPADFELRLEIKMEGPSADSGIQYRSVHPQPAAPRPGQDPKLMTDPRYNVIGLQYDFNQMAGIGTVADSAGRGIVAGEGQVVQTEAGQPPLILGMAAPAEEVRAAAWKMGEWNQVRLIARGHIITQILNGRVTAILFDDDSEKFMSKGLIGLQCSGAGSPKISFRNIWLKELP